MCGLQALVAKVLKCALDVQSRTWLLVIGIIWNNTSPVDNRDNHIEVERNYAYHVMNLIFPISM